MKDEKPFWETRIHPILGYYWTGKKYENKDYFDNRVQGKSKKNKQE